MSCILPRDTSKAPVDASPDLAPVNPSGGRSRARHGRPTSGRLLRPSESRLRQMCQRACSRHGSGGRRRRETSNPDAPRARPRTDAQSTGRRNGGPGWSSHAPPRISLNWIKTPYHEGNRTVQGFRSSSLGSKRVWRTASEDHADASVVRIRGRTSYWRRRAQWSATMWSRSKRCRLFVRARRRHRPLRPEAEAMASGSPEEVAFRPFAEMLAPSETRVLPAPYKDETSDVVEPVRRDPDGSVGRSSLEK
jgi:hypothetical protein